MKKLSLILLVLYLYFSSNSYIITVNADSPRRTILTKEVIDFLKEADAAKYKLQFKCDYNQIIGRIGKIEVAKVVGPYNNFNNAMNVLGRYFSKEAALQELGKLGYCVINNQIGFIMASGDESFSIDNKSSFELVAVNHDKQLIKISLVGEYNSQKVFYYTLRWRQNRWLIEKENKEDDQYVINDNWASVQASSTLFDEKINYKTYWPGNVIDNNPATAWVEGEKGNGIGEWIDFAFFNPINLNMIRIINGYAKSDALYAANNRVKKLKIDFDDGTSLVAELKDSTMEPQLIQISNQKVVERVRLTILEVFPGSKYHDTCISEIGFQ